MKTFINAASAAIAAACLFSTPAMARGIDRMPVAAHIAYADLDLGTEAGRAMLQRRLAWAVRTTCVSHAYGLAGAADARQCRDEMTADATTRFAALLERKGSNAPKAMASR